MVLKVLFVVTNIKLVFPRLIHESLEGFGLMMSATFLDGKLDASIIDIATIANSSDALTLKVVISKGCAQTRSYQRPATKESAHLLF